MNGNSLMNSINSIISEQITSVVDESEIIINYEQQNIKNSEKQLQLYELVDNYSKGNKIKKEPYFKRILFWNKVRNQLYILNHQYEQSCNIYN